MKLLIRTILTAVLSAACATTIMAQNHPEKLYFRYDDRFKANKEYDFAPYDSIEFRNSNCYLINTTTGSRKFLAYGSDPGVFQFVNPGRWLYKPSSMNCDFTNENSQWCFARSQESEHFVVFWEKGVSFDKNYILERAERAWDVYVNKLGFIIPGQSPGTDNYKIVMRMYNSSDWIASGSGEDGAVGTLNLSPSAYQARGGHTVAHEVGHTFQYLTGVDNQSKGTGGFGWGFASNGSGDNCFWEDCADWQAYKVYPERQFTDGEYFERYMGTCHLNMLHEDARYNNCYYQDYFCDRFGMDFIGRIWRECKRPEDPVDAIRRIQNLSQDEFSELMYNCFSHMATWDIESVRDAAQYRIGSHPYCLETKETDSGTWYQVSVDKAPQNYGYNITELKLAKAGQTVTIDFEGMVGATGYRTVNRDLAGWRWGIVTYMSDGTTQYSDMQTATYSAQKGQLQYVVPEGARRMWLVVMGAPKTWWHHEWDRYSNAGEATNNEQWPYRVQMDGTHPVQASRTYTAADFPEGYVRRDTTVVIDAYLPYNATGYTSVRVQYDTDAISEALGVTTFQLHTVQRNATLKAGGLRFAAVNNTGKAFQFNTTTTSSSATCLGHWFKTDGNYCDYGSGSAVFAEMYPESYGCYVGQYPGRLQPGNTYVIRQAIVYNETLTKKYTAIMEVHLHVF